MNEITWSDLEKIEKKAKNGYGLGLAGVITSGLSFLDKTGIGGLFGSNGKSCHDNNMPSLWEICEKQNAENIALTRGIYDGRITDLKEKFDIYKLLDDKISALDKQAGIVNAQLPLMFQLANMSSERYTDGKVGNLNVEFIKSMGAIEYQLSRKVEGTLGLPWGDIITGIPQMPKCTFDVNCHGK